MGKIFSYLGFAKKSNSLKIGQSQIKRCTQKIYLVLVCPTAGDNLKNLAHNVSKRHNCQVVETKIKLEELSNIPDVKILAVLDENLAKAIEKNKE